MTDAAGELRRIANKSPKRSATLVQHLLQPPQTPRP